MAPLTPRGIPRGTHHARYCLDIARVRVRFEDAEREGLVRFETPYDEIADVDYLTCDRECFDTDEQHERHVRETIDRANDKGVWGIRTFARLTPDDDWEEADAVWGFIGEDWVDSGYDDDMRRAALDLLARMQEEAKGMQEISEGCLIVDGCDCR